MTLWVPSAVAAPVSQHTVVHYHGAIWQIFILSWTQAVSYPAIRAAIAHILVL